MFEPLSSDFLCDGVYLNSATVGLACNESVKAMQADIQKWANGKVNSYEYDAIVNRCRSLFATLVEAKSDEVLIANQASTSVGLIAASLPKGTKVLAPEGDFTSLLFPLMAQQSLGVELTLVPLERLVESVSSEYDWIACSVVQSSNGKTINLESLSNAAKASNCKVLLDGTQSVGWMPIKRAYWDVIVCGAYKWLLSPRGTAFAAIKPELFDSITPINANWYSGESPWDSIYGHPLRLASSARRFDISPAWMNWVGTLPALELITSIGVEKIHKHNVGLANLFCSRMGLPPTDSAIVSVKLGDRNADLQKASIAASIRDNALRLSFHLYNSEKDVELVMDALS